MWVLLPGREASLVYLNTQLFPFQKYFQYKPNDGDIMLITAIRVPMVKNILTFMVDKKLCRYVQSFVNILFILKVDTFHFQNVVS